MIAHAELASSTTLCAARPKSDSTCSPKFASSNYTSVSIHRCRTQFWMMIYPRTYKLETLCGVCAL